MFTKRNTRHLGAQRQLFLDDDIIDELSGITRRIGLVYKHAANPLIVPENEWELDHPQLWAGAVLKTAEHGYQLWCETVPEVPESLDQLPDGWVKDIYGRRRFVFNYLNSDDGIKWNRPNLGIVDWRGSTNNNLILREYDHPAVAINPNEPDPNKRYRMLAMGPGKNAIFMLRSPDGIHWTDDGTPGPHRDFNILVRDTFSLFYDQPSRQWVSFLKLDRRIGLWPPTPMRRCIGRCTSEDGGAWDVPEFVLGPDARDDEMARRRLAQVADRLSTNHPEEYFCDFQNIHVFPYEGIYIGFITVFDASGMSHNGNQDGIVRVQLVASRDMRHWTRVADRANFIDIGQKDDFDARMIIGPVPPVIEDDHLRIYYTGSNDSHMDDRRCFRGASEDWKAAHDHLPAATAPSSPGGIGLATVRRDGFVCLQTGHLGGYFRTKHFTFTGNTLYLNVASSAYDRRSGSVRVEFVEPNDTPIPGFTKEDCDEICIDSVQHPVTWTGATDISKLQDRIVRLKFYCNTAQLYAFWFE